MVNQIKRIKLLKLYSENTLFDPVEFKDGINIVLGEKYDSTTTSGSKTNGVGKSILVQFIDFCLLSRYQDSRVSKIPKNIFPENENVNLDLIIGDEKYTISRNRAKENSPNITINGVTTNFPTLKETQDYLFSIIFKDIDLESLPSFRTLLSILIRDEDSEFKDIAKPYDLRKRIPENYEPHLYLLHLSLEIYKNTKEILKQIEMITKVIRNEEKELTNNNTKDISQIKAEMNNINSEVKIIELTLKEYKTAESFKILEQDIASLEDELKQKSSQLKVLYYELNRIKSLPKSEVIDSKDVEILYNSYKESLGTLIVKSLEEATKFKNRVENFQRMLLEDKRNDIQNKINILNKEKKLLDDEYSKKIKVFDTKGVFQNLKTSLRIYQEKSDFLNKTSNLLENFQKHTSEKKNLTREKSNELLFLDKLINDEKNKIISFQDTILDIHEYIMGNRECSFEILTNSNSRSEPLKVILRISDDGSHGIDRIKVFIYDMALLFSNITKNRHPLFLIHDNIFETDENTRIRSLNFINSKLNKSEYEFQYIITLNKDSVEENGYSIPKYSILKSYNQTKFRR